MSLDPGVPDAIDRILLAETDEALAAAGRVVVVDAPVTALIIARRPPTAAPTQVVAFCDAARDRAMLAAAADQALQTPDDPWTALAGAELIIARLPKSLAALDELAGNIRMHAPSARLVAAGLVRHMNRSMNDVLGRHFERVRASRGLGKARALHAAGARGGDVVGYPRRSTVALPGGQQVTACWHGGVFAAGRLDRGTRLLIGTRADWPEAERAVDLGCGWGALTVALAGRTPAPESIVAVDDSWAACASTRATLAANPGVAGVVPAAVHVVHSHALPRGRADLIVCNPPFHRGTGKDSTPAIGMIEQAGERLVPGGELWTVFNAHLPYLPIMRRVVGATAIAARDREFVVTRSVRS